MIKQEKPIERVLIYRLGSLGDTVVALPCLHLIARVFPDAERVILTTLPANKKAPSVSSVLEGSGLVNGYLYYSYKLYDIKGLFQLRGKIKQYGPDILIYLPGQRGYFRMLRDVLFFRSCGIKKIIGIPYTKDLRNNRLFAGSSYFEPEAGRLARCLSTLGDAKLAEPASWDLLLSSRELQDAGQALKSWPGEHKFIVSSIGTKFTANDWGSQNWQALLAQLGSRYPGYGLVFLGSGDEFSRSEELSKSWPAPALNLCGKVSPRVAAALLKRARIFLGHDSGPMHLAASVGTPCVVISGARNKPGIWFPYGASHRVIYHKTDCFGCGLEACRKYNKKCINSIQVNEVYAAFCQAMDGLNHC